MKIRRRENHSGAGGGPVALSVPVCARPGQQFALLSFSLLQCLALTFPVISEGQSGERSKSET